MRLGLPNPRKQESQIISNNDHATSSIHYEHTNTSDTHHFKTTFMCPRSIAGVPSSQALLGFLITAHHLCAFLL